MSADDVRAVLKSKNLREYRESAEMLSGPDRAGGAMRPIANGRFVNVIAAWSAPPGSADNYQADGESYEVLFTPVPGRERVVAIIHSVGYAPANALREAPLEAALAKKYGGYPGAGGLPQSPTWRFQPTGAVEVGDACARRATVGGLSGLAASAPRENVSLKLGTEELRFQVEHCGIAIVTEDQFTANGGALREDRVVTRYTVTAYSPSLALEGASAAARLVQGGSGNPVGVVAVKAPGIPDL